MFWEMEKGLGCTSVQEQTTEAAGHSRPSSAHIGSGQGCGWDVDDDENADRQNPKLKDLTATTLSFGLPEEGMRLDDAEKAKVHEIIEEMRELEPNSG